MVGSKQAVKVGAVFALQGGTVPTLPHKNIFTMFTFETYKNGITFATFTRKGQKVSLKFMEYTPHEMRAKLRKLWNATYATNN